ncbi:MAG: hypothetical protein ICV67_03565 [Thermoleophilia bacterium]|nr:hypothetical protein [Thermoleophilia bacterium]
MAAAPETTWTPQRWERYAPWTGVGAVVLFVAGVFVFEGLGDTPGGEATAEQYLTFFRDEETTIWIGAWLFFLGIFLFLWFLGSLRASLHWAEGGVGRLASVAHAGGLGAALLTATSIGTQVSGTIAASDDRNLSAQAAETLWWVADGIFVTGTFFLAALYAATAIVALRTRVLPLWLGIVSAIFAVVSLVPFVSWAVLFFGTPVWILVVAVWLATRRPAAA